MTELGRLDVLVLNAVHTGAGSMLRLADISPELLTTKLAANVVAQLTLCGRAAGDARPRRRPDHRHHVVLGDP